MANVSFRLNKGKRTPDKTKEYSVYIRVTSGRGKDYNGSLGIKVKPDDWNSQRERIKNRSTLPLRDKHNRILDNLTAYFSEHTINLKYTSKHDYIIRVKELITAFFRDTKSSDINFFSFVEEYIIKAETIPNTQTGKPVSLSTLRGYTTTLNALKRYDKYEKKVSFESIDMDFYYSFIEWCEEQDYTPNTIGTHIKRIKQFMNAANDEGVTTNKEHLNRKFIKPAEETDEIYLTIEELQQMYDLDLTHEPIKEKVRDLFCLGANTGLRVSDYCCLSKFNLKIENGTKWLHVRMKKNGKLVHIPLNTNATKIVEKYEVIGFPQLDGSIINKHITVIGEMIGLTEIERFYITRGGKKVECLKRRCDRIKSHTARRSFCSNAYLAKVPSHDIMVISGHSSEKIFLNYIKLNEVEKATKIGEHAFFK